MPDYIPTPHQRPLQTTALTGASAPWTRAALPSASWSFAPPTSNGRRFKRTGGAYAEDCAVADVADALMQEKRPFELRSRQVWWKQLLQLCEWQLDGHLVVKDLRLILNTSE